MKSELKYFIATIVIILISVGALGFFIIESNKTHNANVKTLQERISKLQVTIERVDNESKISIANQNKKLLETELGLKKSIVKATEDLEDSTDAKVARVKTDVDSLEAETKSQISGLGDKLTDFESQTEAQQDMFQETLNSINVKSSDFTSILDDVLKATVAVRAGSAIGSGVIIEDEGYIITNFHVIEGNEDSINVKLSDNRQGQARLVAFERNVDVAVLKINGGPFHRLKWGDSQNVKAGEKVIAVGSPAGLDFTVTEGIISAPKRLSSNGVTYIQTDVSINPGSSGGPLISDRGRIVGINTLKIKDFEGIGFSIQGKMAKEIADQAIIADSANP